MSTPKYASTSSTNPTGSPASRRALHSSAVSWERRQRDPVGSARPDDGQLGQQRAGLRGQRHRQRPGLVLDLPAQRRIPGVRVDEARGQPVEPQPQQDVLAREIHTRTLRQ